MKKSFETYLTFIEHELSCKLLDWQKKVLHAIYEGYYPYVSGGRRGKMIVCRAAELLKEEINRDIGNLPPHLYELDGYSSDNVMCDEGWGENIIWEKENKL